MQLIEQSDQVFTIPQFLDSQQCAELIALAESRGFAAAGVRTGQGQKAMPMIRNNERVLVESAQWVGLLWWRLSTLALPVLDGTQPAGLPKDLRFYKYLPGQRFKMHKDGPWTEGGMTSKLTLLVYLNEGFAGGETGFRDFKITPSCGTAVLFVHAIWHEGAAATAGTKYVLRSDVLYTAASAAA